MQSIFLMPGMLLMCASVFAQEGASVCVAPVPYATPGSKSLSNATASAKPYEFTITIDNGAPVTASHSASILIGNLSAVTPHLVSIRQGAELVTSFRFRFTNERSNRLCLWFNPLYESWSLWPMSDSKGKCSCGNPAAGSV
ncbi:MAG: hypothetical protein LBI31_04140 [Zoogloeaceae bacterium]|jgi:hypothetical protein|nr:hypothetical protein [Zoogloeaceae bacterium]